ncbi:MAG: PH domain-containing protein [Planctomycetales bacterium]|nr:PH domain-containing protein [Planctomycetales bacterium]
MTCKQCGADAVKDAVFCHKCGAPVGNVTRDITAKQRFAAALSRSDGDDGDGPEQVLWQGKFSHRAMISSWLTAGVFTIALITLAIVAGFPTTGWLGVAAVLAVVWIGLLLLLLYRQVSIHYYLTSERLLHERGLLWREIDRIEAIDVDDVSFHQGPIERMLGVGTVRIRSSDVSTPTFDIQGIDDARHVASMIDEVRRKERRRRGLHIESI